MIETLSFRQVAPQLAPLRFAKTGPLRLAYRGKESERFGTVAETRAALEKQAAPAMILFHPQAIPHELERTFAIAQILQRSQFNNFGSPFLSELQNYCRAVGFATSLELQLDSGQTKELVACNFTAGSPEPEAGTQSLPCNFRAAEPAAAQEAFFGPDYGQLAGCSVIVATRYQALPIGNFSLATFIAHEVACVKLAEQATRTGLAVADISKETEMFFTYAYSYNFTYFLLHFISQLKSQSALTDEQDSDISNVVHNFQTNYHLAMENFAAMSPEEKRRFLIVARPGATMNFGYPFAVELTNQGTPFFSKIKTGLPV